MTIVRAGLGRQAGWRTTAVLAGTAATIYVADQVTKALIVGNLAVGERVPVIGEVVQLWHLRNTGAAFSLFEGATWFFIPFHLAAIVMVIYFHLQYRARGPWIHVVLGAILAGGLGNLTDRLRFGYVVDFVSIGIGDLRWPAFNVADPSLVIGIIILLVYMTFFDRSDTPDESGGEPA